MRAAGCELVRKLSTLLAASRVSGNRSEALGSSQVPQGCLDGASKFVIMFVITCWPFVITRRRRLLILQGCLDGESQ